MITLRPASARGRSSFDWLDSRHTFSFGHYFDRAHMGYRSLRVINDDLIGPGGGFGTHPHEDMEILSWVLEGEMEHRDSMGNGSVIRPGELQRMSAGTGVTHSEYNHSKSSPLHLLQIWLLPERRGLEPSYEQRSFDLDGRRGELVLLASRDGRDGAVTVHQDVELHAARLAAGDALRHSIAPGRGVWLHVAEGVVELGEHVLGAGDGAAYEGEAEVALTAREGAEVLLFDLG